MSLCCLVLNGFHFFLFLSLCGRVSPVRFVLEGADVSLLLGLEWVSLFFLFLSLCGRVSPVRFVLEGADVSLLLGLEWVSLFFVFIIVWAGFACSLCSGGGRCLFVAWS